MIRNLSLSNLILTHYHSEQMCRFTVEAFNYNSRTVGLLWQFFTTILVLYVYYDYFQYNSYAVVYFCVFALVYLLQQF